MSETDIEAVPMDGPKAQLVTDIWALLVAAGEAGLETIAGIEAVANVLGHIIAGGGPEAVRQRLDVLTPVILGAAAEREAGSVVEIRRRGDVH